MYNTKAAKNEHTFMQTGSPMKISSKTQVNFSGFIHRNYTANVVKIDILPEFDGKETSCNKCKLEIEDLKKRLNDKVKKEHDDHLDNPFCMENI